MSSGRQQGELNAQAFATWVASKADDDFRAMANRGVLSRKEVARECGFAKSALDQNPRIKAALRGLEDGLRSRGILPAAFERNADAGGEPVVREPGHLRTALEVERLRRLEQENACLKAEVAELKRTLEKYAVLQDALASTGRLPNDPNADIAFIPCPARAASPGALGIPEMVLQLYRQDPMNTQVLSARRNGPDGTKGLNALCQTSLTASAKPVEVWDERHNAYARVGLHLGDPVLCTRNLWDRGLQNGSLGVVVQVEDEAQALTDEDGNKTGLALAWVDWDDGVRRPIVEEMLEDLELGYAITVHKAQGSQWPRVIVPLTGHRLLDRTLVYTAVTRAQRQVLLVGDEAAAQSAVEGFPRAQSRQVALDLILTAMLKL